MSHDIRITSTVSTDNTLVRFDGTTSAKIQTTSVVCDDSNNISGVATLTLTTVTAASVGSTGISTHGLTAVQGTMVNSLGVGAASSGVTGTLVLNNQAANNTVNHLTLQREGITRGAIRGEQVTSTIGGVAIYGGTGLDLLCKFHETINDFTKRVNIANGLAVGQEVSQGTTGAVSARLFAANSSIGIGGVASGITGSLLINRYGAASLIRGYEDELECYRFETVDGADPGLLIRGNTGAQPMINVAISGTKIFNSLGIAQTAGTTGSLACNSIGTTSINTFGVTAAQATVRNSLGVGVASSGVTGNILVNNNLVMGTTGIPTDATNGFIYVRVSPGTPTGTPTANNGTVAMCYDSTNNIMYVYNGGWKSSIFI